MFDQLVNSWKFDFWLGLASLTFGAAVIAPLLLNKKFRKRFDRSSIDIETIGLVALVVLVISIGCYNYFGAGSGT